jgi:hypothetical protein
MATKPMTQEHNVQTDEVVIREMTDVEFLQYQKDMETSEKILSAQQESAAAKAAAEAKLTALGLTADDLKALGLGNN